MTASKTFQIYSRVDNKLIDEITISENRGIKGRNYFVV